MSGKTYIGISGTSKRVKRMYTGINSTSIVDAYSNSLTRVSITGLPSGVTELAATSTSKHALFGGGEYRSVTYQSGNAYPFGNTEIKDQVTAGPA